MLRVKNMTLLNGKKMSLDISSGEIIEIFGANGIGKSLLLKSVAKLISSSFEELSFNEESSHHYPIEEWRRNVMYLPPDILFDSEYSLEDFLKEPLSFAIHKNFSPVFNSEDYPCPLSEKMSRLSSGQKQQVALLRAMMLGPKILLLDEPFAQMDVKARDHFIKVLKKWCGPDRSIIFVSHVPVDLNHKKIGFD